MNVQIIANPVAGGGRGETMALALRDALTAGGAEVHLCLTGKRGDAETLARMGRADCLVAVGGDGTVNEVVNGMPTGGATLGMLPVGTANVVGRELGLPFDVKGAAPMILAQRTRPMDVGLHGGRRFLLGAGAGLDAAVTREVMARRGKKSSMWRWVAPTVKTVLQYGYPKIRVSVDGKMISESAEYAIVGNCRYSAGLFPATPHARIDDGLLDVCLLHRLSVLRVAQLLGTVWWPGFTEHPEVAYVQGKEVMFEPVADPVPLQVDGDPAGELPAAFGILPRAIHVVVPGIHESVQSLGSRMAA